MGLFDGWFGTRKPEAFKNLDPKLRAFLEKESPVKYQTSEPESKPAPDPVHTAPTNTDASISTSEPCREPLVPRESLYQDGRYAHIWKNYRPLASIEAESKTDHEKIADVVEGYNARKAEIGRAALENCALEQLAWDDCLRNPPDFASRMTMCRADSRKFEKCYLTQAKILKALGYLSSADNDPVQEERIQMHADALYHRILAQEAAIDKARAEGREPPKFAPVNAPAQKQKDVKPSPETEKLWKERLDKLPTGSEERRSEEEALKAELRAQRDVQAKVKEVWKEQARERAARRAQGRETLMDRFETWVGRGENHVGKREDEK